MFIHTNYSLQECAPMLTAVTFLARQSNLVIKGVAVESLHPGSNPANELLISAVTMDMFPDCSVPRLLQ